MFHRHCQVCEEYQNCLMFAGREFLEAEDLLFSARHVSYWDSLEAAIHCFLLAIRVRCVCVCVCARVITWASVYCVYGSDAWEPWNEHHGCHVLPGDWWQMWGKENDNNSNFSHFNSQYYVNYNLTWCFNLIVIIIIVIIIVLVHCVAIYYRKRIMFR